MPSETVVFGGRGGGNRDAIGACLVATVWRTAEGTMCAADAAAAELIGIRRGTGRTHSKKRDQKECNLEVGAMNRC